MASWWWSVYHMNGVDWFLRIHVTFMSNNLSPAEFPDTVSMCCKLNLPPLTSIISTNIDPGLWSLLFLSFWRLYTSYTVCILVYKQLLICTKASCIVCRAQGDEWTGFLYTPVLILLFDECIPQAWTLAMVEPKGSEQPLLHAAESFKK